MNMKHAATAVTLGAALLFTVAAPAFADTNSQDKKFVEDAGKGSLAEIQMAKLALAHSQNKLVREFAQKMIHDHTMLIEEMKPFAQKFDIQPPTSLEPSEQDEYDRLAKKSGTEFDKDYITTMVSDHDQDLADFKHEYSTTDDPQLKATVGKGEKVIQQHHDIIDNIAKKYNLAGQ